MNTKDFIKELNTYLEYPLKEHGERKTEALLERFLKQNVKVKEVVKVVYKDRYITAPIKPAKKLIEVRDIKRIVCEELQLTEEELLCDSRKQTYVFARYCVMYFARFFTYLSLKDISRHLRGEDHTSVIHGIRYISNIIELDGRDDRYTHVSRIYKRINDMARGHDGTIEMQFGKIESVPLKECETTTTS